MAAHGPRKLILRHSKPHSQLFPPLTHLITPSSIILPFPNQAGSRQDNGLPLLVRKRNIKRQSVELSMVTLPTCCGDANLKIFSCSSSLAQFSHMHTPYAHTVKGYKFWEPIDCHLFHGVLVSQVSLVSLGKSQRTVCFKEKCPLA